MRVSRARGSGTTLCFAPLPSLTMMVPWPKSMFEADQAEAGEPGIPIDIGLLGGVAEPAQTDGAADVIADACDFVVRLGQRAGRIHGSHLCRRNPVGFASEGSMIGFQRFGLVCESPPVERFRPRNAKDVASQQRHGADSLLKLPCREAGPTAERLEKLAGGGRALRGDGGEPCCGPAQKVGPCLGRNVADVQQPLIGREKICWL